MLSANAVGQLMHGFQGRRVGVGCVVPGGCGLKTSSLASIIGFSDLMRNAQDIYYNNAKVIELLMVAGVWYLVVVSVASVGQAGLERRFGRGHAAGLRR